MCWKVCSVALICDQQRKCLLMRHKSMQPDWESANRDVRKLFNRYSSMEFKNIIFRLFLSTPTPTPNNKKKKHDIEGGP